MSMPAQKHRDASTEYVKPRLLLLHHCVASPANPSASAAAFILRVVVGIRRSGGGHEQFCRKNIGDGEKIGLDLDWNREEKERS